MRIIIIVALLIGVLVLASKFIIFPTPEQKHAMEICMKHNDTQCVEDIFSK